MYQWSMNARQHKAPLRGAWVRYCALYGFTWNVVADARRRRGKRASVSSQYLDRRARPIRRHEPRPRVELEAAQPGPRLLADGSVASRVELSTQKPVQ